MSVLTDAEYAQLSPAEQAQYWRRRYYDLETERDRLRFANEMFRTALGQIRDKAAYSLSFDQAE